MCVCVYGGGVEILSSFTDTESLALCIVVTEWDYLVSLGYDLYYILIPRDTGIVLEIISN